MVTSKVRRSGCQGEGGRSGGQEVREWGLVSQEVRRSGRGYLVRRSGRGCLVRRSGRGCLVRRSGRGCLVRSHLTHAVVSEERGQSVEGGQEEGWEAGGAGGGQAGLLWGAGAGVDVEAEGC